MTKKPTPRIAAHIRRSKRLQKHGKTSSYKQRFRKAHLEVSGWIARNASKIRERVESLKPYHTATFKFPEAWLHFHFVSLTRQLENFAINSLPEPRKVQVNVTPSKQTVSVRVFPTKTTAPAKLEVVSFIEKLWSTNE